MPRNSSGVYTLPVAAFVPGQVIASADTNSNNSDIGAALTQSLASTGVTAMTGQIKAFEGAAASPSYAWASDLDTGMYHVASGQFAFVSNGNIVATVNPDGSVDFAGSITVAGDVTFSGNITFGGDVVVSANASFPGGITGETTFSNTAAPVILLNRTENDAANKGIIAFTFGNGSGTGAVLNGVGDSANGLASLQLASSTGTDLLDINVATGLITIPHALILNNYEDLTEIATPAAPAAGVTRFYANAAGLPAYQLPAGVENPLAAVFVSSATFTTVSLIEIPIPADARELLVFFNNYISSGAAIPQIQVSQSGVYVTSANYDAARTLVNTAGTQAGSATQGGTSAGLLSAGVTATGGSLALRVFRPNGNDGLKSFLFEGALFSSGGLAFIGGALGFTLNNSPIDKFKLIPSTGNLSSIVDVYKLV